LALAGVLARQPKVILFDEPTSMLDPRSRSEFLQRIIALNQQGITILYVTHHMEETVHADQIVVLQGGQIALQGSPPEIYCHNDKLHEIGVEKPEAVDLADHMRQLGWEIPPRTLTSNQLLQALPIYEGDKIGHEHIKPEAKSHLDIQIEDVHYAYLAGTLLEKQALRGASVNIPEGQIHGFAGTNGSGKSTLLQHINGILRPSHGYIKVADLRLEDQTTPLREIIKKVGLVFQNPETQFFEVFVGDEIAYGPKQFQMKDIRERVRQAMMLVGLDFETYKDRRLETLSGGEKRKVALASTLVLEQDILLFDEPTAGMDPNARAALLKLFQKLNKQGKTVVIASHRLEELALVSHQLSIMAKGKVEMSDSSPLVLSDMVAINNSGLQAPLAVRVGLKLIEQGWPFCAAGIITKDQLLQSIRGVIS